MRNAIHEMSRQGTRMATIKEEQVGHMGTNDSNRTVGARRAGGRRRGAVLGGFAALAALVVAASTAWACTLLIGQLTVCQPPRANDGFNASECSRRTGVGLQSGMAGVDNVGDTISVDGDGFSIPGPVPLLGTAYSITFRKGGSASNCHAYNPDGGVTSLLGVDGSGKPVTTTGPNFYYGSLTTPSFTQGDIPPPLGAAQVCVQDEPERVDGNFVALAVI